MEVQASKRQKLEGNTSPVVYLGTETQTGLSERLSLLLKLAEQEGTSSEICSKLLADLEDMANSLQKAIDLNSLPELARTNMIDPTMPNAKRIATYAHKLSYTTFAPSVVLGQNLHRPPAPQEWEFRASVLHMLGRHFQKSDSDPLPETQEAELDPRQQSQEVELQAERLPEKEPAAKEKQQDVVEANQVNVPPAGISSAFDFILNPDMEEVEEEFSSSEEEEESE